MVRNDDLSDVYIAIRDAHAKSATAMESSLAAIKMIEIHQAECIGRQKLIDLQLKIIMGMLTTCILAGGGIVAALLTKSLGG